MNWLVSKESAIDTRDPSFPGGHKKFDVLGAEIGHSASTRGKNLRFVNVLKVK